MANTPDKVINVAKGEKGYLEKKSNKDLNSKTANAGSNNYTKYGAWYGDNPDYWCAMFICWCFQQAYGSVGRSMLFGGYSAACETMRKRFVNAGRFYKSNPKVGDCIFFTGTRHSGANHIGLVTSVSGNKVYTIEGNTSGGSSVVDNGGGVAEKSYATSNSRIMGYGRPNYDASAGSASVSAQKGYTGDFPTLPSRGYFTLGDGYKQLTGSATKTQIKRVQSFLNWAVGAGLTVDGDYGGKTSAAVITFQKAVKISADGKFGKNTLAKAKEYKK